MTCINGPRGNRSIFSNLFSRILVGSPMTIHSLILTSALLTFAVADPVADLRGQKLWREVLRPDPVIEGGSLLERAIWNDPCVRMEANEYVMYLTSSTKEPFKPPVLPFRAISKDGLEWKLSPETPLLTTKGTPFVSIETPSVVRFNETFHLFYTGVFPPGQVPSMAIGHATSPDGLTWTHREQPALQASGKVIEWNGYLVAEPAALVHNDKLYLYFTAMGSRLDPSGTKVGDPPQLQSIGLAISQDGTTFGLQQQILTQGPTYPPEKRFVGYSTPFAVSIADSIHLFYDVTINLKGAEPEWQQVALHHASSPNGIKGFIEDSSPLLTRNDFTWTSGEILAPSILVDGDDLCLWFSGHVSYAKMPPFIHRGFQGPEFGIGHARLPLARFLADKR